MTQSVQGGQAANSAQAGNNTQSGSGANKNNGPSASQFKQEIDKALAAQDSDPKLSNGKTDKPSSISAFQGHDGHEDPDDNPAMIASASVLSQEAASNANFEYSGVIYGDTTSARQDGLAGKGPLASSKAQANYEFFQEKGTPAIQQISDVPIYDTIDGNHSWNLNPESPGNLDKVYDDSTNGGQALAMDIAKSISDPGRATVYVAGGGQNAAAEAINILEAAGISEEAIKDNFAIVQHSGWNWDKANEGGNTGAAANITKPYTMFISDQNIELGNRGDKNVGAHSGKDGNNTFKSIQGGGDVGNAWNSALSGSGINGLQGIKDASDAGEALFVTDYGRSGGSFAADFASGAGRNFPNNVSKSNDDTFANQKQDGRIGYLGPVGGNAAAQFVQDTVEAAAKG